MKIWKVCVGSISALAGILLIILLGINIFLIQEGFLNYTNEKYGVADRIRIAQDELEDVVHSMVSYVKWDLESPQITVNIDGKATYFFNEKEIGHLEDVRMLIGKVYVAMALLFAILLGGLLFFMWKKDYLVIVKGIYWAWILLVIPVVGIGIISAVDINLVINGFHQLFLSDSNWVLNPSFDRSVWMFWSDMYIDAVVVLGAIVLVTFLLSIGIAGVIRRKVKILPGKLNNRN